MTLTYTALAFQDLESEDILDAIKALVSCETNLKGFLTTQEIDFSNSRDPIIGARVELIRQYMLPCLEYQMRSYEIVRSHYFSVVDRYTASAGKKVPSIETFCEDLEEMACFVLEFFNTYSKLHPDQFDSFKRRILFIMTSATNFVLGVNDGELAVEDEWLAIRAKIDTLSDTLKEKQLAICWNNLKLELEGKENG